MKEAYHQLDPVPLRRAEFEKLQLRQDVKGEKYDPEVLYRDSAYPKEVFRWVPYDREHARDHGVRGEWQMGFAELKG